MGDGGFLQDKTKEDRGDGRYSRDRSFRSCNQGVVDDSKHHAIRALSKRIGVILNLNTETAVAYKVDIITN